MSGNELGERLPIGLEVVCLAGIVVLAPGSGEESPALPVLRVGCCNVDSETFSAAPPAARKEFESFVRVSET
jgi:hypothetical protein